MKNEVLSIIYIFIFSLVSSGCMLAANGILCTDILGYEVEHKKRWRLWLAAACIFCAVVMTISYIVLGVEQGLLFIIYVIAVVVITGLHMPERRFRSFFVAFVCTEIMGDILTMLVDMVSVSLAGKMDLTAERLLAFVPYIAILSITVLLALYAKKKRMEQVAFANIVLLFIISMFLPPNQNADYNFGVITVYISFEEAENAAAKIIFMDAVMSAALLVMLIVVVKNTQMTYYRKMSLLNEHYLETQRQHYDSLMQSDSRMRRLRHDMKNHIFCINELVHRKQYEELENYVKDLQEEYNHADARVRTGNGIADAIITEKMLQAEKEGITIHVDGVMTGLSLSALHTCTILANLLDNAIEAVKRVEAENREIYLSFHKTEHFLLITETNRTEKEVQITDNHVRSTRRGANHGFGLLNIKAAAENYGGEVHLGAKRDETGKPLFQIEIMLPLNEIREKIEE